MLPNHTQANVVRNLLIGLGLGTAHGSGDSPASDWPIYSPNTPDTPDKMIAVSNTQGTDNGRGFTGKRYENPGVIITVRGKTEDEACVKAKQVVDALDRVQYREVSIDSSHYVIHTLIRSSGPLNLGMAVPASRRYMFTINYLVSFRMTN